MPLEGCDRRHLSSTVQAGFTVSVISYFRGHEMGSVSAIRRDANCFDPLAAGLIGMAFDLAWADIVRSEDGARVDSDEARECLAKRIFEMAQRGERDLERLRDYGLAGFKL
jgi:hypothetical protein